MAWDDLFQTHADLGWVWRGRGREIADIAVIARHRRNRETNPLRRHRDTGNSQDRKNLTADQRW